MAQLETERGSEEESLPPFARHFKVDYVATKAFSPLFKHSRLVQCHFNIPITHLRAPSSFDRVAQHMTTFLEQRFGLQLPVPSIQHGYFELCAVPLLQEVGQDLADLQPATTYFKGTFNLMNGRNSLLWEKTKLESSKQIATCLRFALDEENIRHAMIGRYRDSRWLFVRLAAVICVCVFLDAASQAAHRALKRPTTVHFSSSH